MTGSGSRPGAEKSRFKAAQSVLNPSGGQQTCRRHGGEALCAMHMEGARPTGNTMNPGNTVFQHSLRECQVPWKFRGTWHPCSQVPISISLISPIGPISLPAVSALRNVLCQLTEHTAMCCGISGAHGTHTAMCQSSDLSDLSDLSDILCSQYRLCAMHTARQ